MPSVNDLSVTYIKENKKQLFLRFADPNVYKPVEGPVAYFMAGSPGAGKTETSKVFISELEAKEPNRKIVRIDADEIRDWIPYYDRKNASEVQHGAGLGVAKLFDLVLEKNLDFLLDGTFADLNKSRTNITRCIDHKRKIAVLFLYQEPVAAWNFTCKREALEGRHVPLEFFVESFIQAKENVNVIKREFGKQVELNLFIKNPDQTIAKTEFNIDNVDSYLKMLYTAEEITRLIEQSKV